MSRLLAAAVPQRPIAARPVTMAVILLTVGTGRSGAGGPKVEEQLSPTPAAVVHARTLWVPLEAPDRVRSSTMSAPARHRLRTAASAGVGMRMATNSPHGLGAPGAGVSFVGLALSPKALEDQRGSDDLRSARPSTSAAAPSRSRWAQPPNRRTPGDAPVECGAPGLPALSANFQPSSRAQKHAACESGPRRKEQSR